MSKNLQIIAGAAIIIIAISVGYYFFVFLPESQKEKAGIELFELNIRCRELAEEFAEEWKARCSPCLVRVIRTAYNIERGSCFGEFDYYVEAQGGYFSEYSIWDLATKRNLDILTHTKENPNKDFDDYLAEHSPGYYELRVEVFGLDSRQGEF